MNIFHLLNLLGEGEGVCYGFFKVVEMLFKERRGNIEYGHNKTSSSQMYFYFLAMLINFSLISF